MQPGRKSIASRAVTPLSRFAHTLTLLGLGLVLGSTAAPSIQALDLHDAVVVHGPDLSKVERKAVTMLLEEVAKRSQVQWTEATRWPTNGKPAIALGLSSAWSQFAGPRATNAVVPLGTPALAPEGFSLRVESGNTPNPGVLIAGHDPRGVLYGVGYLLRQLRMERGRVHVPDSLALTTAPKYPLRGHQLGYRPKTHSYDAWDLPQWDQYIRDLVVFGINAIELIPPRSDDDADSPHFPRPPLEMMAGMSRLADDYGLDVWVWYPALDADYTKAATMELALREWRNVFEKLPRLDAVFVPGGDPGHTPPRALMDLLAAQTISLRQVHPKAQMWMSPQGFTKPWLDEFFAILHDDDTDFLSGLVYGPQVHGSLPELRAAAPARMGIRHYPDITHTRQCQFPVPDWDVAFAVTEGRECINPRPLDEAAIFRKVQPGSLGFISYSEGCNDDVNKAVWSGLGWDPDRPVIEILREFSRYFIGDRLSEGFAQGLLALEQNWRGPVAANGGIETTLLQFQQMERQATPQQTANWRFQQALFRAYYDAYIRRRLSHETSLESQALEQLADARRLGSVVAMREAEAVLDHSLTDRTAAPLRARISELAEALFQSIRMQLSVERYKAIDVDRGAALDTVDYPLNNRAWLRDRFAKIRCLPTEAARLQALREIVEWTNPGPGGFYDDLGNPARQPHLVRGLPFAEDPGSLVSSKTGFEEGDVVDEPDEAPEGPLRVSWMDHAESLHEQPLQVRYTGLEPGAQYRIRIIYGGDAPKRKIRLVAGENTEIHPFQPKEFPYRPREFDIPSSAIREGTLTLTWTREPGLGANGRGCQVAELWLIKR